MRISPCHGCPVKPGCDKYAAIKRTVHGIGATSVKFKCDVIAGKIPPGTRVMLSFPIEVPGDWREVQMTALPATVLEINDKAMFCAVMDKDERILDDKYRWRKRKHVSRIVKILDEPRRAICQFANPMLPDGTCDNSSVCMCAEKKAREAEWTTL